MHPTSRRVTGIFHSLVFIMFWNADIITLGPQGALLPFVFISSVFGCPVVLCQTRSEGKPGSESPCA